MAQVPDLQGGLGGGSIGVEKGGTEGKARSQKPSPLSFARMPLLPLPLPSTGERGTWKEINFDPWILALGPKLGWKAEVSRTLSAPSLPPNAPSPLLPRPCKLPCRRRRSSSRRGWQSGEGGRLGAEGRAAGAGPVPPLAATPGRKRLSREPPPEGRSSGGRAPKPWRVGQQARGPRPRRGARRREQGACPGLLGRGLGSLPLWDPGDTSGSLLPGQAG